MHTVESFQELTKNQAKSLIQKATPAWLPAARAFVEGDHYQGGDGWIGPMLAETHPLSTRGGEETDRIFTSMNVAEMAIDRHADGVIGHMPTFKLVPRVRKPKKDAKPGEEENSKQQEAVDAINNWLNERGGQETAYNIICTLLFAERGMARLYVPGGIIRDFGGKLPPAATLEEALSYIYLDHPLPEQSVMVTAEDHPAQLGVFAAPLAEGGETVELCYLKNPNNRESPTVLRVIGKDSDEKFEFQFGGRLPMFEMRRKRLVNEQFFQQQRALNALLTMLPKTAQTSAWLERIFFDCELPGDWIEVDDGKGGKKKEFVPGAYQTGPGTTNFMKGSLVQEHDEYGNIIGESTAKPSGLFREPSDTQPIILPIWTMYRLLLEMVHQAHVLANAEGEQSGKSRQESRADFEKSLKRTERHVERFMRWLVETLLAMGEAIMGQPGLYTKEFRCTAQCRLDVGPIDPDEDRANEEAVDRGHLSLEEYLTRRGIGDVETVVRQIRESPAQRMLLMQKAAEIIQKLFAGGVETESAIEVVAELSGLEPELVKKLKPKPEPEVTNVPLPGGGSSIRPKAGAAPKKGSLTGSKKIEQ